MFRAYNWLMAMGTRKQRERQEELWYDGELATAFQGTAFTTSGFNEVLDNAGFDTFFFCESQCAGVLSPRN